MKFHKKIWVACVAVTLFFVSTAEAKTILLVPQDNRPVSLAYTVSTAEKAGYTVLTPPSAYLSGSNYQGQPDKLWTWVLQNMQYADACVFSTDSLIYGGLVDSRKHNDSLLVLMNREAQFAQLHKQYPSVPIYAFGTIMRTPSASDSGVEPYYYSDYGPKIYRISALQDKADLNTITSEESSELLALKLSVPAEYLQDWFSRRTKNTMVNEKLISDTQKGVFSYFCLGHDDSSPNSQSAMESRYLSQDSQKLPVQHYGSFPGADQLALLMIARYHVELHKLHPTFTAIYPLGDGADTVPSYESQPIGRTIADHVAAVEGTMITKKEPDVLLAVNTPLASTGESEQFSNFAMLRNSTIEFVNRIQSAEERGIPVAVVDVYFANGSDNTLMNLLSKNNLLSRLAAYNGWNTASNTIGYSIAQSILAPSMTEEDHQMMLDEQYLDNWGYQANVRKNIYRLQDSIRTDKVRYSAAVPERLQTEMVAELQKFAKDKLGMDPRTVSADFPWGRLFEVHVYVAPSPRYPVVKSPFAAAPAPAAPAAGSSTAADASAVFLPVPSSNEQAVPQP